MDRAYNREDVDRFLDDLRREVCDSLPEILSGRAARVQKEDGSYVTEGDLTVQSVIAKSFDRIFPEGVMVSEEMPLPGNSNNEPIVVVVDPIDGTENFTSGLPEWGISVACYSYGKHMGSIIGCPEMNLWLKTGNPTLRFTSRIHGLSSSLSKEDILKATQGYEYRILGCCVYNMLNVIRGSFYSFENPKGANTWDILAGLNLALEHGLKVQIEGDTYAGEYLPPDRKYRFKIENR